MKLLSLFVVSLLYSLVVCGICPAPPQTLESLLSEKMEEIREKHSINTIYLIEFIGVGDCVKCTYTSTSIKKILLKDSIIAKRCKYVASPITIRRKDAVVIMEDNTIYDTYIVITTKELSDGDIIVKDKFLLLDKSLKVRYRVSADMYLDNNFIKDMILECHKIAKE